MILCIAIARIELCRLNDGPPRPSRALWITVLKPKRLKPNLRKVCYVWSHVFHAGSPPNTTSLLMLFF